MRQIRSDVADFCLRCVIFHLVFDKEKRGSYAWNGVNSFYIQKPPHQEHLNFTQDGNHAANVIKKQIPHSRDRWYQLTVTWDAAAKKRLTRLRS